MAAIALSHSLSPMIAAAFVAGMCWVSTMTTLNVAMQLRSPEAILGRCLSIYQAVTFGGMALGAWLLGVVADLWTLPAAVATAAVWLAVSSLLLRFVAPMPRRDRSAERRGGTECVSTCRSSGSPYP